MAESAERCAIRRGSEFADSLKLLVKQKLAEGRNENQIYDYLKNKYGEWILYDPEFGKNTYFHDEILIGPDF